MKTLDQIENIDDLDSRVIHAAAVLEAELRPRSAKANQELKLGELVQQQKCFAKNGFLRDVNFALSVRNAIAHPSDRVEPTSDEKARAAKYLIDAIKLVRQAANKDANTGKTALDANGAKMARGNRVKRETQPNERQEAFSFADPVIYTDLRKIPSRAVATESTVAEVFNTAATRAALKAIYSGRRARAMFCAAAVSIGAVAMCAFAGHAFPPLMILGGGALIAVSILFGGSGGVSISRSQYYSLPGSRFDNGDHRCIFCGARAVDGRGIYTHGGYRSSTRFHECTACKTELFVS